MRLFDFKCPTCGRIERDVNVRYGHSVDVYCYSGPGCDVDDGHGLVWGTRMVRQIAAANLIGETVART